MCQHSVRVVIHCYYILKIKAAKENLPKVWFSVAH